MREIAHSGERLIRRGDATEKEDKQAVSDFASQMSVFIGVRDDSLVY
jgi:hypothetical protein